MLALENRGSADQREMPGETLLVCRLLPKPKNSSSEVAQFKHSFFFGLLSELFQTFQSWVNSTAVQETGLLPQLLNLIGVYIGECALGDRDEPLEI